jgi:hypothetical protein
MTCFRRLLAFHALPAPLTNHAEHRRLVLGLCVQDLSGQLKSGHCHSRTHAERSNPLAVRLNEIELQL